MQGSVFRIGLRERGVGYPAGFLVFAIALAWTALAVACLIGSLEVSASTPMTLAGLLFPPAGLSAAALFRETPSSVVTAAAAWTSVGSIAIVAGHILETQALVGVALPAACLAGAVCLRFPGGAVVALFLLSGTFGSLAAFTSAPVGPAADLLVAGLLLAALVPYAFGFRERAVLVWPGLALLALYILLTLAYAVAGANLSEALLSFRLTAWYTVPVFVIAYAGWPTQTYDFLARGFVAVAALVGSYATLRWMIGPADLELTEVAKKTRLFDEDKTFGSLSSRHQLGFWTAAAIPFCVAYASVQVGGRWRFLAGAAAMLCALGLFASEARAGLVAAILGVLIVVAIRVVARGFPALQLGAIAATVVLAISVSVAAYAVTVQGSDKSRERFAAILTPNEDPAFNERKQKWGDALEEIRAHPFGQGLGSAREVSTSGSSVSVARRNVDSSFLKIGLEQGVAAMLLFGGAMLALLLSLGRRSAVTLDPRKATFGTGACGTLGAFLVLLSTGVYVEGLHALAAWAIVGLGVAQFSLLEPLKAADPGPSEAGV